MQFFNQFILYIEIFINVFAGENGQASMKFLVIYGTVLVFFPQVLVQ